MERGWGGVGWGGVGWGGLGMGRGGVGWGGVRWAPNSPDLYPDPTPCPARPPLPTRLMLDRPLHLPLTGKRALLQKLPLGCRLWGEWCGVLDVGQGVCGQLTSRWHMVGWAGQGVGRGGVGVEKSGVGGVGSWWRGVGGVGWWREVGRGVGRGGRRVVGGCGASKFLGPSSYGQPQTFPVI